GSPTTPITFVLPWHTCAQTPGALRLPGLQHVARTRPKAASRPCVTDVRRRLGRRQGPACIQPDSPHSPDKAGGRIREPHHAHHLRPSVAHVRPDPGCASLTRATAHAERSPNKVEGRIAPLRDRSAMTPGPSPRPRHLKARFPA